MVYSTGVRGGVCLVSCVNVVVSACCSIRRAAGTPACCSSRLGSSDSDVWTGTEGTAGYDATDVEGDDRTELVSHSALSSFSL
jgi:hypothetical protein